MFAPGRNVPVPLLTVTVSRPYRLFLYFITHPVEMNVQTRSSGSTFTKARHRNIRRPIHQATAALGLNMALPISPPRLSISSRKSKYSVMGFDRLAPHYDWMEQVTAGGMLQRVRLSCLKNLRATRVLLAGEGHGKFLVPLCESLPSAEITCLDASARMLEVARRRMEKEIPCVSGRIEWVHAALPRWSPPEESYDLVVTNFFLDCFDGVLLKHVVQALSKSIQPGGAWLISDFAVPAHPLARPPAHLALWLMYRFFRRSTGLPARSLDSPFPILSSQGYLRTQKHDALFGFLTSQLWHRPADAVL